MAVPKRRRIDGGPTYRKVNVNKRARLTPSVSATSTLVDGSSRKIFTFP